MAVARRSFAQRVLGKANRAIAHLPFLAAKDRVYDDEFFAYIDDAHRPMYERVSASIYEQVRPQTAVDVGCGTGFILARLAERGVDVRGIEGSRAAIQRSEIGERIMRANLDRGVPQIGRFDLCICIEVAEHLPERSAKPLVDGLTGLSDTVLFTAAVPGQGTGTHHINEQPHEYWHALFSDAGFGLSDLADRIRADIADIPTPTWMHANLMSFARR